MPRRGVTMTELVAVLAILTILFGSAAVTFDHVTNRSSKAAAANTLATAQVAVRRVHASHGGSPPADTAAFLAALDVPGITFTADESTGRDVVSVAVDGSETWLAVDDGNRCLVVRDRPDVLEGNADIDWFEAASPSQCRAATARTVDLSVVTGAGVIGGTSADQPATINF